MRIGLHALGIGAGADPLVISAVARAAEHCGFATLWAGEHVVMVDRPDSTYPYADDGRIAVPSAADWLDPLDLLAFLSATTSTIRLATGVLLLPEHNPVVVAKRAATVDVLSGGRLTLGVGIGWSAEEFAALGVPFHGRGTRAEEYIDVLRALWRDDVASHTGSHVQFDRVRCVSEADPPRPFRWCSGGTATGRWNEWPGARDGWYGFNVSLETLPERLGFLRSACQERGRRRVRARHSGRPGRGVRDRPPGARGPGGDRARAGGGATSRRPRRMRPGWRGWPAPGGSRRDHELAQH